MVGVRWKILSAQRVLPERAEEVSRIYEKHLRRGCHDESLQRITTIDATKPNQLDATLRRLASFRNRSGLLRQHKEVGSEYIFSSSGR